MAESAKRSQQNTNKTKKPKNDLVKSSLGTYLKGRNYTATEKYRKSDIKLTQTPIDMAIRVLIDGDVSRPNSFSYSNVFCLNNNPTQVDQQFSKFSSFIESQKPAIKYELQNMLPPLLCHLYIEMLKGRDWRPAFEFLKKYASIIAPIDSVNTVLPHKLNGSVNCNTPILNDDLSSQQNGISQIVFLSETYSNDNSDDFLINESNIRESFKELIQILSTITRIQEIETNSVASAFRSCKFQIKLSEKSTNILKRYLAKQGHVLILQIIQVWFHIEIDEAIEFLTDDDSDEDDEISVYNNSMEDNSVGKVNEKLVISNQTTNVNNNRNKTNLNPFQIENNIKIELAKHKPISIKTKTGVDEDSTNDISKIKGNNYIKENKSIFSYPENFNRIVARDELIESYKKIECKTPIRLLNIKSDNNRLCSAYMDKDECHIACGFDNSNISLWTLKKSIYYGRKPFSCLSERLCEWNIENCDRFEIESSSSNNYSSSEDEDIIVNRFRRRTTKKVKWKNFMQLQNSQNKINSNGALTLRGHGSAVTDVLLSQHNPLLYSVSKDLTMRAWKATDYTCASVYRGHNYPLWCVAESSNGLYVATGSKDTTARLWSTDRKFPLIVYVGHTQDVDAIAFHPNGNYIATGSADLSVRLWCVTSGKLFRVFTDCKLPIQTIAFSPNGKYLAAAGEETKIRIFDLAGGSQLTELRDISAPVSSISWNQNSNSFACASIDGSYKVWSTTEMGVESSSKSHHNQMPSTSSSSSSTSLSSSLIYSNATNCKRLIKVQYNIDSSISLIGNS